MRSPWRRCWHHTLGFLSQIRLPFFINDPVSDVLLQQRKTDFNMSIPSGVDDSFLRLEGGASRLMALGWCSGERTMADMAICCLAVAGVDGCGWSVALRWAAAETPQSLSEDQTERLAHGCLSRTRGQKGRGCANLATPRRLENSDLGHIWNGNAWAANRG